MAARAVIKDVGRVLDLPYAMVDNIAKMVPREIGITIDKAINENPDLRNEYENNEAVRDLIDKSKGLRDFHGTHLCTPQEFLYVESQ